MSTVRGYLAYRGRISCVPWEDRSLYDIVAFSPPVYTGTMKTIMKTQTFEYATKLDLFENQGYENGTL